MTLPCKQDQGKIGIKYLKHFWSAVMLNRIGIQSVEIDPSYSTAVFDCLGLGLEPSYNYLYQESPTFEEFENWIIANGTISNKMIEMFNAALDGNKQFNHSEDGGQKILDDEMLQFWEDNGYVIIKNAIPSNDCDATVKEIEEFLKIDLSDKSSWYQWHKSKKGIMVQFFNHPILMKNRLSGKIQKAYQEIWDRKDLVVSIDRVSFNPPETKDYKFPGPSLHWDVSLKTPIPFGLQGLLYLNDTPENQGAFTLVPGFHQKIETWLKALPSDTTPRTEDLYKLGAKPISAEAGDFIIWHHALPHGSSPNSGSNPRIVQYINYQPLDRKIHQEWI